MSGLFLCSPHSLDTALLSTSLKMPFSLLLHLMNLGQQSLSCNSISTENSHQSNQSHLKQFEQELPQVGGGALPGLALAGDPVRPHLGRPGLLLGPLELGLVRAGEGDGVGGVVAGVRVRVGGRGTRTCEMNIFRSCKNIWCIVENIDLVLGTRGCVGGRRARGWRGAAARGRWATAGQGSGRTPSSRTLGLFGLLGQSECDNNMLLEL